MQKHLLSASAAAMLIAPASGDTRVSAELLVSTAVIDRGEQIGGPAIEATLEASTGLSGGWLYGGAYRLTPVGADQAAFPDEVDYTLGYRWESEAYSVDVSASWLTYPGEGEDESVELVGALSLNAPLSPAIIAFYDADFKDHGAELVAGPEGETAGLAWSAKARAGFVKPGDGSPARNYAGIELLTAYLLGDAAEIGAFARIDFADEESFASDLSGGQVTDARTSGAGAGVFIAAAF